MAGAEEPVGHPPLEHTTGPPFVAVGAARLPRSLAGEQPGCLMLELVLNSADGSITDVATSVALPGHTALLKRLLLGRPLDEVEAIARDLCAYYRGPLLRPTIAALVNAVANTRNGDHHASPD